MIHERDYLRLKRSMIYASGDSCGKSRAIVSIIRGKWTHSPDKRSACNVAQLHPALASTPPPPSRCVVVLSSSGAVTLHESAMIKQRRGDAPL